MLNKTPFIIEELITRGFIKEEDSSEVETIINGNIQSKEYKVKKQIAEALTNELNYYGLNLSINLEDVNKIYDIITSKFKEDIKLSNQDIKDQVKQYYIKNYRYKNNLKGIDLYINPFRF